MPRRPGWLAYVHFRAISCRCQHSNVSSVRDRGDLAQDRTDHPIRPRSQPSAISVGETQSPGPKLAPQEPVFFDQLRDRLRARVAAEKMKYGASGISPPAMYAAAIVAALTMARLGSGLSRPNSKRIMKSTPRLGPFLQRADHWGGVLGTNAVGSEHIGQTGGQRKGNGQARTDSVRDDSARRTR